MMSQASGSNQAWLWAGNNIEPYPFCVTGAGDTYIRRVANTREWSGKSLDEILDAIKGELNSLSSRIDSIGDGNSGEE